VFEGVSSGFFVKGYLQFNSWEKLINSDAEFDQGLILVLGKIPHVHHSAIYLSAEVTSFTVSA
jgi:hypothetical protein